MENPTNSGPLAEKWSGWILLALAALSLLAGLGTHGLIEPDEGRYAELGREMAADGDWLIPHLNGNPHFQKPPMIYWATAASLKIFGVSAASARLPSALAGLGIVALTFAVARVLFGRAIAVVATAILISSFEFFVLARTITPDMLMSFWITAAIACLVFYVKRGQRWYFQLGFFAAMGLGFMTKGPMALIIPISAAVCWQRAARRAGESFRLRWEMGMPFTLGIALSWFVVASLRHPALFDYFWRFELVERFASKAHGRAKPFWFFFPVLVAGFFPWSFFLPALVRQLWTNRRELRSWPLTHWPLIDWVLRLVGKLGVLAGKTPTHWLLLGWVVPPFIILSISGSKLPTYILPLFPGLAISVALFLQKKWKLSAEMQLRRLPLTIAVSAVVVWLIALRFADWFNPLLRQQASVRPLAQKLVELKAQDAPLFAWQVRAFGICFYLRRPIHLSESEADLVLPPDAAQTARLLKSTEECERIAPPGQPAYGIVRSAAFAETFSPRGWKELERAGDFVLIRRLRRTSPASP
ncbi:MAG: glycosyltransferase family 39 protein [Verrucomicrobia bacterium]|nr:glycosyltransferase family 39 protein [Verrucomicrobiota bacterium]